MIMICSRNKGDTKNGKEKNKEEWRTGRDSKKEEERKVFKVRRGDA